jgi:UDP-glucose 4-epimerase
MKIAVTGGSGQLGTRVLERLAGERSVKRVVSIDLIPPTVASPKIQHASLDIRDPAMAAQLAGCDAVIHLAFVVSGWLPRPEFDDINVNGSRNVFHAAAAGGAKQIIYTSSVAAYGVAPGHPVPIVEDTPRRHVPDFPYSSAKYEVEQVLDGFEREHPAIAVARLRPAIILGAEHGLAGALRRGVLPDTGPTPIPLVWREDVADAVILALKKGARGAFNLAADEALPAADLARATGLKLMRFPPQVQAAVRSLVSIATPLLHRARQVPLLRGRIRPPPDPAWLRASGAVMVMSSARARSELGWTPRAGTCTEVMRRHLELMSRRTDRRLSVFFRVVDLAARYTPIPDEARSVSAVIHLALTGPDGGDFTLRIDRGRISIKPGVPRPPTSALTMPAGLFFDMLAGRADYYTAQVTGKIRITGDPIAGMVLGGMVGQFRASRERPGLAGAAARGFYRWMTGDASARKQGAPA